MIEVDQMAPGELAAIPEFARSSIIRPAAKRYVVQRKLMPNQTWIKNTDLDRFNQNNQRYDVWTSVRSAEVAP